MLIVSLLKLTGAGHDDLKIKLLKPCLPAILTGVLCHIFNCSLQAGIS